VTLYGELHWLYPINPFHDPRNRIKSEKAQVERFGLFFKNNL
jgi:hypothetical protein